MKKLFIGLGSIVLMACVVVLFVNADGSKNGSQKATTEVSSDVTATPCSATCGHPATEKNLSCDPAKCKETTCMKTEKCDPATCPVHKEGTKKKAQSCEQMAGCSSTCGSETK
jgi:hypothetical protein